MFEGACAHSLRFQAERRWQLPWPPDLDLPGGSLNSWPEASREFRRFSVLGRGVAQQSPPTRTLGGGGLDMPGMGLGVRGVAVRGVAAREAAGDVTVRLGQRVDMELRGRSSSPALAAQRGRCQASLLPPVCRRPKSSIRRRHRAMRH